MLTIEEVSQYIRLTLKQHKLEHVSVVWSPSKDTGFLGLANPWQNEITLNKRILGSFKLFEIVLKHEIAHFLQYQANGNKFFVKNGRRSFHGPDFRIQCRKLGIPVAAKLDVDKYLRNATVAA